MPHDILPVVAIPQQKRETVIVFKNLIFFQQYY
jgi:hypothetical protein